MLDDDRLALTKDAIVNAIVDTCGDGSEQPGGLIHINEAICALTTCLGVFIAQTSSESQAEYLVRIGAMLPELVDEAREPAGAFVPVSVQ